MSFLSLRKKNPKIWKFGLIKIHKKKMFLLPLIMTRQSQTLFLTILREALLLKTLVLEVRAPKLLLLLILL